MYFGAVGLGAITVIAAKGLQKAALAISALACEALQADVSSLALHLYCMPMHGCQRLGNLF